MIEQILHLPSLFPCIIVIIFLPYDSDLYHKYVTITQHNDSYNSFPPFNSTISSFSSLLSSLFTSFSVIFVGQEDDDIFQYYFLSLFYFFPSAKVHWCKRKWSNESKCSTIFGCSLSFIPGIVEREREREKLELQTQQEWNRIGPSKFFAFSLILLFLINEWSFRSIVTTCTTLPRKKRRKETK